MKRTLVYAALFVLVVALVFSVQPAGQVETSYEGNTILTCNSLMGGTLVAESSDSEPPISPDGDGGTGGPPDN